MKHVKLNPYFNHAPHHKSTWGSRGTAPWILNTSSQFHTLATVPPAPTEQNAWSPSQSSCHTKNKPQSLHQAACRLVTKSAELNTICFCLHV
jgi:hypothetical protein